MQKNGVENQCCEFDAVRRVPVSSNCCNFCLNKRYDGSVKNSLHVQHATGK